MQADGLKQSGFYLLLAVFAALTSYRLHLAGFEEVVEAGLADILAGEGRAPDQYRIFPYLVLAAGKSLVDVVNVNSESWRSAIILFESASLFGALLVLHQLAAGNRHRVLILTLAMLLYPLLMMDGVRSIASFILLISAAQLWLAQQSAGPGVRLAYFVLLLLFCFTRADVALLVGLTGAVLLGLSLLEKALVIALPLLVQLLLSTVIFPGAEYYSDLVMLNDNLTRGYLLANPLTYLLVAALVLGWQQVVSCVSRLWQFSPLLLLVLAGYIAAVFVLGRPNEYRLFLPYLAIGLALWPRLSLLSPGAPDSVERAERNTSI